MKEIIRTINFNKSPKKNKLVAKSRRRLGVIVNTLLREVKRKVSTEILPLYKDQFAFFERAINQKKDDKNKIYSLHEPKVLCIAKGKKHKKYEFGSKASVVVGKKVVGDAINLLMAAAAFNFKKWMRANALYFNFIIFVVFASQRRQARLEKI